MKNAIIFPLLLMVFLSSTLSFGQEVNNNTSSDDSVRNIKNEFSFELLQLINGVYQLSYERQIWKNFSGSLGFGYKGKEGLVRFSGIDTEKIKTGDLYYTGFMVIPEIRYYVNGTSKIDNNLTGFFIGLYYKYSDYTSDLNGTYIDSEGVNYNLAFDADMSISSVGLMIGYKLAITKRLNLDFIIAGPGSASYKFNLKNTEDLPDEFYEDLNQALEDYGLLDLINSDFRFSNTDTRSDFSTIAFRYGIALGYTF